MIKFQLPKIQFDRKKKVVLAAVIAPAALAILVAGFLFGSDSAESPAVTVEPAVEEEKVRRRLDGVWVESEQANLKPFAVMIDNHVESRPPSGLSQAKLVWEAPVEGGFTRYLAVYDGFEEASEVGPVRSARPYYLDWAAEVDAVYLHVGGSPEGLEKLRTTGQDHLDQFFQSQYYWRSGRRPSPHNVFTSAGLFKQAVEDKKYLQPEFAGWSYKEDLSLAERPEGVEDLVIEHSAPEFEVAWRYDRENNLYQRYLYDRPHTDVDTRPILAKNVAVQFAKVAVIDDYGRRKISTVDEGRALIALDGQVIDGTWKKESRTSRTRFYDQSGDEILFNAGTTWIEVVPKGTSVIY